MPIVRRSWFAFALVTAILGLEALTTFYPAVHGQLVQSFGLSGPDLAHLEVYRLVVSPLVQTRPGFVGTVWITLLFVAPVAAWRLGAWRSAIVYFLGDWAGSLLILMTLGAASLLGSTSAHQYWTTHDVGSSSGVYALGFAAALTLPGRVRVAVAAAVIAVFTSRVVIAGRVFDYQHAVSLAAAVGVVRLMSLGHAPNDLIPQAGKYGPRTQGPRARSHCSAPESIAEDLLDRSNQRT